eukprot:GEMP01051427.1.p1 GENE.GEMP01051427.1~~GEMP01051427.1.p1  ORF type:complete len:181 (+),score=31.94 GEMP01051427.1:95-637(+)
MNRIAMMMRNLLRVPTSIVEKLYEERKLVICVRTDLNMSIGKVAAQVGHAVHTNVRQSSMKELSIWECIGSKKITLAVTSLDELKDLKSNAREQGLVANSIRDAGHTEVEPGTITVLAIGPAAVSEVDKITGKLKPVREERQKEMDKLKRKLESSQEEVRALKKQNEQLLGLLRSHTVLQ